MEKKFVTAGAIEAEHWNPEFFKELIPKRSFCKIKRLPVVIRGADNTAFMSPDGKSGWGYNDGWNGSYHEAYYSPIIYAWGKGKKKHQLANAKYQEALEWLSGRETVDPSIARFEARRQVREGD
jgi:hypothetical protein